MLLRMSEMIDRVETAIFEAVGYSIPLEMCREAAIAAVRVMREPTGPMLAAGCELLPRDASVPHEREAGYVWEAMIDSALK